MPSGNTGLEADWGKRCDLLLSAERRKEGQAGKKSGKVIK